MAKPGRTDPRSVLHVGVTSDDGWLIAQGLEEPGVITQARSFDELMANLRDAAAALLGSGAPIIELIVPEGVVAGPKRPARRRAARRLPRPTRSAVQRGAWLVGLSPIG